MKCPTLLLDFRKENGHGRRITAAQIMDDEKKYRMQWGDGSYSALLSRDVIQHWPRLLFDFLVAKIKWYMPVDACGLQSIDSTTPIESINIVGNATKVLCKFIRSKIQILHVFYSSYNAVNIWDNNSFPDVTDVKANMLFYVEFPHN